MKKALVVTDQHGYHYDKQTLKIQMQIAQDTKPDYLIFLGDCIDGEGISKFTAKNFAEGALDTVNEIEFFKENYFEPLVKACNNKNLKVIWALGNHSQPRIDEFLRKLQDSKFHYQYKLYKKLLDIKSYFPGVIFRDYNETYKIGKLHFTHGEYHSKNHALDHALHYGASVMYGHIHTHSVAVAATKGDKKVHTAISIPCSCKLDPKYMKRRSSAWVNGLAIVDFLDNGQFQDTVLKVINNKVIYNGKIYG